MLRMLDVNGKSGTGDVWEGVEFDNKWVAGRWMHDISSKVYYVNIEEMISIHGHEGNTIIQDSEYGELFELRSRNDLNKVSAQGCICSDNSVILSFLNNTSIYFLDSLEHLEYIYGSKYKINKIEVSKV